MAQSASAPGADLRRQLGELAANPSSVSELVETGRTALALGDGEAALGFFTRASQLAPQDSRVKAGLAAANTRTGRPETALVLFSEALAAGAPLADVAAERGLAYDLLGQPARAQQDYLVSLKQREDPEVRRRLALSLAISGQSEAALRLLDPQVRSGDRAGSRARIMVLALSGDVNGANAAARSGLPAAQAQAITPFLSRLASLNPAQMAAAANLGRLPSGGVRSAGAGRAKVAADPNALAFAGGGNVAALSSRLPVAPAAGVTDGVGRRPGAVNSAARSPSPSGAGDTARTLASARLPAAALREAGRPSSGSWTPPVTSAIGSVAAKPIGGTANAPAALLQPHPYEPLKLAAPTSAVQPRPVQAAAVQEPVELAGAAGGPRVPQAELKSEEPVLTGGAAAPSRPVQPTQVQAAPVQVAQVDLPAAQPAPPLQQVSQQSGATAPLVDGAAANLAVWTGGVESAPKPSSEPSPAPTRLTTPKPAFSDVVAAISSLPVETGGAAAKPRAETGSTTSTGAGSTAARSTRPATPRATAPAHPSRIWVQLGVSADRAAFNYEINRMRRAAPDLFKDRTAHVAPIGERHRLLVGPFADAAAARSFINGLKEKEIIAISWTSPAGTEVERFAARR